MILIDYSRKGVRKGEELKAPRYTNAAATHNYITTRDIIPNNFRTKSTATEYCGEAFKAYICFRNLKEEIIAFYKVSNIAFIDYKNTKQSSQEYLFILFRELIN